MMAGVPGLTPLTSTPKNGLGFSQSPTCRRGSGWSVRVTMTSHATGHGLGVGRGRNRYLEPKRRAAGLRLR